MKAGPLYLLDTNTVTYIVSGRSAAAQRAYLEDEDRVRIRISAITEGEIRFGLAKKTAGVAARRFMLDFLSRVESVPWDSAAASAYGTLRAQLTATGQTLGALDTLIAAHALSIGATVVTHDRAFRWLMPMLPVVDWATDL